MPDSDPDPIDTRSIPARRGTPWWLWPNLLCLDAPLVATVWLWAFARAYAMPVPGAACAALFLATWSLYAADRLIDGMRLRAGDPAPGLKSARHDFATRHGRWLGLVAIFASVTGLGIALSGLERQILGVGAIVVVGALAYFGAFVAPFGGKKPLPGKEIAGGLLIAAGVTAAVFGDYSGRLPVTPAFAIFAALCALNCLMLNARDGDSPLPDWLPAVLGIIVAAAAAMAGGHADWPGQFRLLHLGFGISAAALTLLQLCRRAASREAFHVLADVAMLSPLVWLFLGE